MHELTVTRHNALVDPLLQVWSWQIPVYLFLGGWVAGMMIIVAYFLLKGRHRQDTCVCSILPALSLGLLSIGMVALFLDLEHKIQVWRLYTTFQLRSPMSWGAWILVLVYPSLAALWLVKLPPIFRGVWPTLDRLSEAVTNRPVAVKGIAIANLVLGVALGIYTG